MGLAKKSTRKATKQDQVSELVDLVRAQMTQQSEVLKIALETQKAQAEMLGKWMGLFQPQGAPTPSTSMDEREKMRELAEREAEWEAAHLEPNPFTNLTDLT